MVARVCRCDALANGVDPDVLESVCTVLPACTAAGMHYAEGCLLLWCAGDYSQHLLCVVIYGIDRLVS